MRQVRLGLEYVTGLIASYWGGAAVHAAVKLGIFDVIEKGPISCEGLAKRLSVDGAILQHLMLSMVELRLLTRDGFKFRLSAKGRFLCRDNPVSYNDSSIMWWEEHLDAWRNLEFTVKTGTPTFNRLFGMPFFDWLDKNPSSLELYQNAMTEYASVDYADVPEHLKKSSPRTILDIGGGLGILLVLILNELPQATGTLMERPPVLKLAKKRWKGSPIEKRLVLLSEDMFKASPGKFDTIIMARVLHDWNDNRTLQLLSKAKSWLTPKGHLFIIERANGGRETKTPLLDLDLAVTVGGRERSLVDWKTILEQIGMNILAIHQLKSGMAVIDCTSKCLRISASTKTIKLN